MLYSFTVDSRAHTKARGENAMGISLCDQCHKPNDIAQECNYCSKCREAFHQQSKQLRAEDQRKYDEYWSERGR
jgi:hypothetical protein